MSNVVLVTAIGTVTASTVVKELRKIGSFHIIGADINNRYEIATSLDTDEFYKFPLGINDEYIPFALDFCAKHKVDYYFAVIDKEVLNISSKRDEFAAVGTKLCVANSDFIDVCHYKDRFSEWVLKNIPEIAIKTYKGLDDAKNADYPLFIKPVEGVASSGCRKVNSFEELTLAVADEKSYVIQDYVEGSNVTVEAAEFV